MDADPVDGFGAALAASLAEGRLARLTLAKARGDGEGQTRVIVRPVEVGGRRQFAVTERYPTRDVTCNEDAERLLARVRGAVGRRFLSATLFTLDEDIHLDFNRRGQARLTRTPPSLSALPSPAHDRVKHRLLDVGLPFLRALGVTDADGKVAGVHGRKMAADRQVHRDR